VERAETLVFAVINGGGRRGRDLPSAVRAASDAAIALSVKEAGFLRCHLEKPSFFAEVGLRRAVDFCCRRCGGRERILRHTRRSFRRRRWIGEESDRNRERTWIWRIR
jgi:hypothetical protein